jgi:hypothetical protein
MAMAAVKENPSIIMVSWVIFDWRAWTQDDDDDDGAVADGLQDTGVSVWFLKINYYSSLDGQRGRAQTGILALDVTRKLMIKF